MNSNKINLYCIKCSTFSKDNNIKIKHKVDGKINIFSHCIDYGLISLKLLVKNK